MKHLLLVLGISLPSASFIHGQGSSGLRVVRVGVANVHSLPGPNLHSRAQSHSVLVDDPELFQGQKLEAQNGGTGFPAAAITETASTLNISAGFAGLTLSDTPGYVPPDTQVAAGINGGSTLNLVEMVNGTIRIYDLAGTTLNTADMCSFFFCDFLTAVISDPIVRYDPDSKRWFASVVTIEYVVQGAFLVPEGQWRLAV